MSTTGCRLKSVAPLFLVDDVARAADYYRDVLGFRVGDFYGDPPCFVIVWRDEAEIMLSYLGRPGLARPNGGHKPHGTWDAYVRVSDVEALLRELLGRGAHTVRGPEVTFYDMKEL